VGGLTAAETELQTITEYQARLMPLVYGVAKPSFDEAYRTFKACALALLETL
jgi:hypothetical protein